MANLPAIYSIDGIFSVSSTTCTARDENTLAILNIVKVRIRLINLLYLIVGFKFFSCSRGAHNSLQSCTAWLKSRLKTYNLSNLPQTLQSLI